MRQGQCQNCGRFLGKRNTKWIRGSWEYPEDGELLCIDCWLKEYRPKFGPTIFQLPWKETLEFIKAGH